jgi:hypothetical protein
VKLASYNFSESIIKGFLEESERKIKAKKRSQAAEDRLSVVRQGIHDSAILHKKGAEQKRGLNALGLNPQHKFHLVAGEGELVL